MRIIRKVVIAITVLLFIWVMISFFQVNAHNRVGADPMTPEEQKTNAFCLYSRMLN